MEYAKLASLIHLAEISYFPITATPSLACVKPQSEMAKPKQHFYEAVELLLSVKHSENHNFVQTRGIEIFINNKGLI